MTWLSRYRPQRRQYWPAVEQFFAGLPPPLFEQGLLLKNNLATFFSDTGRFDQILSRPQDLPLLYLHFWLLDDLQVSAGPTRTGLEKHLFLAAFFTFAASYTQALIRDEGSNFDPSYLFLAQTLSQQANLQLGRLYPGHSPFWTHYHKYWQTHATAALSTGPNASPGHRLALTKLPVAAVATSTHQAGLLPRLCQMMDHFNAAFQILRDITTLRRDLLRHHHSYPIHKTIQETGLDPHAPPEQILGALVLSGTVEKVGQEALTHLAKCRAISTGLALPTFTAYWQTVAGLVDEARQLFDLNAPPAPHPRRLIFAPAIDTVPKLVEMAEGYLLSDPTFRESWEVQRRGLFGLPEMTGKAFPAGLIIEILSQHRHSLPGPVNMVFDTLQATGYRYYNHDHLPPDTDDLGLLLRLFAYSDRPHQHRQILQPPLRQLADAMPASGQIPVWLTGQQKQAGQAPVALWGQRCATVEANLLLGLIMFDWPNYRELIQQSAQNLFERWQTQGLGATHHYRPLYALWTALELVGQLNSRPIASNLRATLSQVIPRLVDDLTVETNRSQLTPQSAAFLTLACHSAGLPLPVRSLFNPRWITHLGKTQRYDGSWAGEPLFGTPTRGELATWYSSRPVTTAFCYHALKTYQSAQKAAGQN